MNASIKEFQQKIKGLFELLEKRDIFTALIIILVSFLSFGLGRISKIEERRIPVKIDVEGQAAGAFFATDTKNTMYVASKNGGSYHFPWCPGAKRIKEENKIWFTTKKEAEEAGYRAAGNCAGL